MSEHGTYRANIKTPFLCDRSDLEQCGGTENLTKEQAVELVKKALRVCYLRDCRASLRYHIAVIDAAGMVTNEIFSLFWFG